MERPRFLAALQEFNVCLKQIQNLFVLHLFTVNCCESVPWYKLLRAAPGLLPPLPPLPPSCRQPPNPTCSTTHSPPRPPPSLFSLKQKHGGAFSTLMSSTCKHLIYPTGGPWTIYLFIYIYLHIYIKHMAFLKANENRAS